MYLAPPSSSCSRLFFSTLTHSVVACVTWLPPPQLVIGDASIKELSIPACNGLIHVVDQPVLPYLDEVVMHNPARDDDDDDELDDGGEYDETSLAVMEPRTAGVTSPLGEAISTAGRNASQLPSFLRLVVDRLVRSFRPV